MNAELGAVCNRALEALFNGALQGIFVVGLFWLGLKLTPGLNAATRYAANFAALLIVAALPLLEFARLSDWGGQTEGIVEESESPVLSAIPEPEETAASAPVAEFVQTTEATEPLSAADEPDEPAATGSTSWKFSVPAIVAATLLTVWVFIAACRLARLLRQCFLLRAIKRKAQPAPQDLEERFAVLRREMRVRRRVELVLSEVLPAPIAAGFLHARILLPSKLVLAERPARLDGILRHELAHVCRWDDWTNLIQQMAHAIFFFHPAVCWLSSRLSVEREIACDDHALAALSSRREYALLLTEFASRMQGRDWAAAPGAWSKNGQLKERIAMILNADRNRSTRLGRASAALLTVAAALVALFAMQAGPRVALADDSAAESGAATTASITVSSEDGVQTITATPPAAGIVAPAVIATEPHGLVAASGPRVKSDLHIAPPSIAVAANVAPMASVALPALPALAADLPPDPPNAGNPPSPRNRDLEKRLERLERLVDKLANEKKGERKSDMHFEFKDDFGPKFQEKMAKLETDLKNKFENPEWQRGIEEHAKRAAEEAARHAEKMSRDMARLNEKFQNRNITEEKHIEIHSDGAPADVKRRALEEQHRALEKQLHAIERQLQAIEQEHDHADRDRERAERDRERADRDRERADRDRQRAEQERNRAREQADQDRQEKQNKDADESPKPEPKKRKQ